MKSTTLAQYYRAIDEGRLDEALGLLGETVRFAIVVPTGTHRGEGREDMRRYLSGRGVPDRGHVLLRDSRDGDVEFVYGKVTEGAMTTGHFLAAARIDPNGLVQSYHVAFDAEHLLLED